jgi:hypothetical protein
MVETDKELFIPFSTISRLSICFQHSALETGGLTPFTGISPPISPSPLETPPVPSDGTGKELEPDTGTPGKGLEPGKEIEPDTGLLEPGKELEPDVGESSLGIGVLEAFLTANLFLPIVEV